MNVRTFSADDFSSAPQYSANSLESRLEEILVIAYETAVEAGLEPRQALVVISRWLASEQGNYENTFATAQ
ncbi:MAG: hypothetical protein WAN43_12040 [Rhodomicrobium sp.]